MCVSSLSLSCNDIHSPGGHTYTCAHAHLFTVLFPDSEVESDDKLVDGVAPTLKRRRLAREDGLQKALASGLCHEFFAFRDRKVLSFATNVFPETMSDTVVRLQSDGTLKHQSVPLLCCQRTTSTCMGGVDRTGQMRKVYGYDCHRKSKRYWLRLYFHLLDVAISNS